MPIRIPTSPTAHLPFEIAGWACALVLGVALYRWRFKDAALRLQASAGSGYFVALAFGAVWGSWLAGSLTTLGQSSPALSHSVLGALAGAIVGVEGYKAIRRVRGSTGGLFVGPLAIGVAVGRWGCLFAGLPDRTYGTPAKLPWAVDLGDGIGRHPVQVYESVAMILFLGVYIEGLARRRNWALLHGFYAFCVWYGLQRFAWELLKPYPRVLGPITLFELICGGLAVYGVVGWRASARRAQERAVPVPGPDHQPV